jgi:hypothetical protein
MSSKLEMPPTDMDVNVNPKGIVLQDLKGVKSGINP